VLLVVTVWFLFPFLMGGQEVDGACAVPHWWAMDSVLVAQFGLLHSLLLLPAVRNRLETLIPGRLYGCFFTLTTCVSLLLLILAWETSPIVLWQFTGPGTLAMHLAYVLCWVALLYSLSLSGFGFQTGWTPFWAWVRDEKTPRRVFEVRGAYRFLRHPVYLSFMGQVWCTPVMTLDRALLTGLLTAYIFLGSYLKDRRLLLYLGDVYRDYQARVPGYPVVGLGPLGRVRMPSPPTEPMLAGE
jgi:protein-S-isoprenylcysteine O-methyltransferase Ste14